MSTAARPQLSAEPRSVTGKRVAALRRDGRLPAVVFGHGVASTSVSLDAHEFELLRRRTSANSLVDLSIGGERPQPVLVHGVQLHRVTRRPLHADLFLVRMTEELTVDVPLVATGESDAVKTHGGTLLHPIERIRVKALPDHIPSSIHYDVSGLATFDDVIRLRDLTFPDDVTVLTDFDEIVARVQPPRVEEEPAAAEAPAEVAEVGEAGQAEPGSAEAGSTEG